VGQFGCGADAIPMSYSFPSIGNLVVMVGRTPWSARVPLDPLFTNAINLIKTEQADEGVCCGPGGSAPLGT
jgi:hypothetical protein